MNIPIKLKLQLLFLLVLINAVVYILTGINKKSKIDTVLNSDFKMLNAHYEVLLESQKQTANALYKSTININRVIEIMKEANLVSKEEKVKLREELHNILKIKYGIAQESGVLQYQFVLPNNKSFYRAHKLSKFGDDLTDIRADIKYTNETKKPIRGFTQGRTAHAFRNIFPLFDKDNIYVGALEISFSSENLQWYLNNVSHIHSHFIVDKKIFDAKTWKRDDLILTYVQSPESKDYMLNLGTIHTKEVCIIDNKIKLEVIKQEIDYKMSLGEGFSTYAKNKTNYEVISFLPIKNIDKKVVAWVVSYIQSDSIKTAIKNNIVIRITSFIISLLIIYLLIKQILSKEELEKQHKLLNNILNETDNVMFITDFKDIKYSNNKFNDLINIKDVDIFNNEQDHNILNIFEHKDGYLHNGLLIDDEDFVSLISRTLKKDRIVSILDKSFEQSTFKISISKIENEDYLVTLSDVTKMKEHQVKTEKKAYMDGLTNVYNRNKFDDILKDEIKYVHRYDNPLSLAILDIDKFKDFNDTYGHLVGDEVLITMAETVNNRVRETDTFARWGGEEFVILFKNTNARTAKVISENLRKKIQDNKHPTAGSITASFGVTEYKKGDTTETIFKRCDDALYLAKKNGRNRVVIL